MPIRRFIVLIVLAVALGACATSPTGRTQFHAFPSEQMDSMGVQAYQQMQEETPTTEDPETAAYVECVTDALIAEVPDEYADEEWEVTVFRSDDVNAFALPGGKVGVYAGLLDVAETPAQLAAVVGHEIGHVMAEHGNERMSAQLAATAGLTAAAVLAGSDGGDRQTALGLLGLGAQGGIILPFSRIHESEADRIGLDLIAAAGFDPREAVTLWQNMAEASGGGGPPEFLSTHPSEDTRIRGLEAQMPEAMERYERARAAGNRPDCQPPA